MQVEPEVEDQRIGFVSQALGHLEQEWGGLAREAREAREARARAQPHTQGDMDRAASNYDFQDYPPPGSVRNFHLESQYHEPDHRFEVASGFYDETDNRGEYGHSWAERERRDQMYYGGDAERPGVRISPKHQIRSR